MLKDFLLAALAVVPFAVRRAPAALPAEAHTGDVIDLEAECIDHDPAAPAEVNARTPEPQSQAAEASPERGPRYRRHINPHEAVMRFGVWMRDWGFVGWQPADDIVGFYQWFCDEEGLEEMNHDLLRERFASAPGVTRERRRLNGTSDREMLRIKRRLGGADRAMLYRVSSHEELAEQAKSRKRGPRPARAGRKAGNKPKTVPNTVSATPCGTHASSVTRRAA